MMPSRRAVGFGLLAVGAGGTLGWSLLRGTEPARLSGFVGGEKIGFVENPKAVARLRDLDIALDARRAGSIEMVSAAPILEQRPDVLWPATGVALDYGRSLGLRTHRDGDSFTSPIVVYTWRPIAMALTVHGVASVDGAGVRRLDMRAFLALVEGERSWAEIGVPEIYGKVLPTSTDPTRSASGFLFAGLLADLVAGDVADSAAVDRHGDRVRQLFKRMGYKESSSGRLFDSFVQGGIGTRPMVVGYENQIVEFVLANQDLWQGVAADTRPVILYPQPTVVADHPVASLGPEGDPFVEALKDERLLEIAWRDHGFRGPLGAVGPGRAGVEGVPPTVTSVVAMPDVETMVRLLGDVRAA